MPPLFIVPHTVREDGVIGQLAESIRFLNEHDDAIREHYERIDVIPVQLPVGGTTIETTIPDARPGFNVLHPDGRVQCSIRTMTQMGIPNIAMPDHASFRHIADLGRALLDALRSDTCIRSEDPDWKSAINILSSPAINKQWDRVLYLGAYASGYGSGEGRPAEVRYMNGSVIQDRRFFETHRPVYNVIHTLTGTACFTFGSSVHFVKSDHQLPGGIDSFIPAKLAARVEGLTE